MVKLPRIRMPPLRRAKPAVPSSVRGRIIAGFGLLVIILVVVVTASAWLHREHQSDMAEMELHAATASLLQDTQTNANVSVLLLERYVVSGDETLVPEIRSSAAAAVDSLAEARAQEEMAGDDEHLARIDAISAAAASLPDAEEQVIALRQSGDLQEAAAAVDETASTFREFRLELGEVTCAGAPGCVGPAQPGGQDG